MIAPAPSMTRKTRQAWELGKSKKFPEGVGVSDVKMTKTSPLPGIQGDNAKNGARESRGEVWCLKARERL